MCYENDGKDALHIVAIVRALHDAQRFLGGLSAEEFAENDEKQNAVAMAIARAGEQAKKLPDEFRNMEPDVSWCGVSVTCTIGLRMITMSLIATGCTMP